MNPPGVFTRLKLLRSRPDLLSAALLLFCILLAFGWRAQHGIWFTTFSDESGHLVGAKAVSAGYRLYKDFVDEHGPLIYALPQLYGFIFGWNDLNYVRLIPVLFLALATLALAFSPVLSGMWERLMAAALFVGLAATVWLVQALFMLDYQPLAGMLLLIGVAQFTLPVCLGAPVSATGLFLGGLMFAITPFVAFTYGPASVFFALCGIWVWMLERPRRALKYFVVGAAAGTAAPVAWMMAYADFRGYLAFHFIAAMRFYTPYLPFGRAPALTVLRPNFAPAYIVQSLGTAAAAISISGLGLIVARAHGRTRLWAMLIPFGLGFLGVLFTNPRGSVIFQNGAFIVLVFGLAAMTLTILPRLYAPAADPAWRVGLVAAAMLMILAVERLARSAVTTPHNYTRAELAESEHGKLNQSDAPWAQKLRLLTDSDETTLALPFYPDFYLLAGRLPMRGYYIYLPWDADFGKQPVLGLKHDLCVDLAKNPPPVLYYNGWVVWNKYDPRNYMPCVLDVISRRYQKMPGERDLFIRNDRMDRLKS